MKSLFSILFAVVFIQLLTAQAPQSINYQGVARSSTGQPLPNQNLKIRLSALAGSPTGALAYQEIHSVQTNAFGLYQLLIGTGGAQVGNFSAIGWDASPHFLKVEMDATGGSNFQQIGSPSVLASVPYALEAAHASRVELFGDAKGSSNATTVQAIQNRPVNPAAPASGQVLKWDGAQWKPSDDATSGGNSLSPGAGISISGGIVSNTGDLDAANELQQISLAGNALSLSKNGGTVVLPAGSAPLSAGTGIDINGNVIYNTGDLDAANELQQISLAGNALSLSKNGGTVVLPAGSPPLSPGTGISISGNVIQNTGDLDDANELQQISLAGNVLNLSNGGGSVTLPTGGGGFSLPYSGTTSSANAAFKVVNNGAGSAIHGITNGGGDAAIVGEDPTGSLAGVRGYSTGSYGVLGFSDSGIGVLGQSTNGKGVSASASTATGVALEASNLFGGLAMNVTGKAQFNDGVFIGSAEKIIDGGTYRFQFNGTLTSDLNNADNLGTTDNRWNTVYATNGTINTSDATLKRDIQPLGYGLANVMKLQPVSFQWIDGRPGEGRIMGFLAQDLQKVIPEVVRDKEWVLENEDRSSGHWQPAAKLGVAYSEIIPVLTKAIQEQQLVIEQLQKRIEQLEKH